MSRLVEHAKHELALVENDEGFMKGLVKVVQAFEDMEHCGGSAEVAIDILEKLLRFEPITEITDDPAEWEYRYCVWQNKRYSKALSYDGGKTHALVLPNGGLGPVVVTKKAGK